MDQYVKIFKALADQNRLKLLDLLLTHDLCVGALANRLELSKPAVSQHLQILRKAGLVKGEKRGYWTHYSIERGTLHRIAEEIHRKGDVSPFAQEGCQRTVSDSIITTNDRRNTYMCNDCCRQPEKLKGKPEECSPEQIKECHGDGQDHPCVKGAHPDDNPR